jgi:hypothetical protein
MTLEPFWPFLEESNQGFLKILQILENSAHIRRFQEEYQINNAEKHSNKQTHVLTNKIFGLSFKVNR